MEAWCAPCNLGLGPNDAVAPRPLPLREWQDRALPVVLERLYEAGVATLHAAPGAGKTVFSAEVFRSLVRARYVDRLVVVVPSVALVQQWKEALGKLAIHVDDQPRDGIFEHPQTVGAVVTYQSLPSGARGHRARLDAARTLVVLDEVHHVGEKKAWGHAVQTVIGDAGAGEIHPVAVLNMTGTLFRSSGQLRISTVRYQEVQTDDGAKYEAVADYSVPTVALIGTALRPPDLYVFGAQAELIDLRTEQVIAGDIADLDRESRRAVISVQNESRQWVEGFAREAVRLLLNQQRALGHEEPLKMLYVASNQRAARRAADALNTVTGEDFARLVVSDEPNALRTLSNARRERRSCAIVAVRMVTEGFDCPAVSTIAYASNVVAELFVAQMMARAMRITDTERRLGMVLPAQILVPDHADLRRAFASALVNRMHVLDVPDEAIPPIPGGEGPGGGEPRLPRFQLRELSAPDFRLATVLGEVDGDVLAAEYEEWKQALTPLGVPETYVPRVATAARRVRRFPRLYEPVEPSGPVVSDADPRTVNMAHRKRLTRLAGWMKMHVEHDSRYDNVGVFQGQANDAAGIPFGGRDQATHDQLATCAAWMTARIYEHCERWDEQPPSWLEDGG
jgi:superfamily II DNA or RNA helicase